MSGSKKVEELSSNVILAVMDVMESSSAEEFQGKSTLLRDGYRALKEYISSTAVFIGDQNNERDANDKIVRTVVLVGHTVSGILEAKEDVLNGNTEAESELLTCRQQIAREVKTIIDLGKTLQSFQN